MKTIQLFGILMLISLSITVNKSAAQERTVEQNRPVQQQSEAQRKQAIKSFYRNNLKVDSIKAEKVAQIQEAYKKSLNLVMADTSLNETTKRTKIQALIDSKNKQFDNLLTPEQKAKIVPTTERIPVKNRQ